MFSFIQELTGETLVKLGVALLTICYVAFELVGNVQYSILNLAAAMG